MKNFLIGTPVWIRGSQGEEITKMLRRLLLFGLIFFIAKFSFAAEIDWSGEFNQSWSNPLNWDDEQVPADGDDVYLWNATSVNKNVNYDTSDLSLNNLVVNNGINLNLPNNLSVVNSEIIGLDAGSSTINHSFGANNVIGDFILGSQLGAAGTYNQNGGDLLVGGWAIIGNDGRGIFNHTGGKFELTGGSADLYLGFYPDSHGEYSLSNAAILNTGWQYVGYFGEGVFDQYGGTNSQLTGFNPSGHEFNVGTEAGSHGVYNLIGGKLETVNAFIAHFGDSTGTLNQAGGIHYVGANLIVGGSHVDYELNLDESVIKDSITPRQGNGTYILNSPLPDDPSLVNLDVTGNTYLGNGGTGTFNHLQGSHRIQGDLNIGNMAVYDIRDGNENLIDKVLMPGTGTYNLNGGNLTIGGTLTVQNHKDAIGTFNMAGGKLTANGIVNNGVFNHSGGEVFADVENHGTLFAKGIFTGNLLNKGVVNPGSSPGMLTINGDYSQDALGVLNIELAGLDQGTQYDFLNITGSANLAGTLNVSLLNSFSPAIGNTFDILYAEKGLGGTTFNFANLPNDGRAWALSYGVNTVKLAVVPEPVSSALFLLGAGALAGVRRLRKKNLLKKLDKGIRSD